MRGMHPMMFLVRLVRVTRFYFALTVLFAMMELFWLPIPVGLASRAFFDALSAQQPAGLTVWSAIALLVIVQVVEVWTGPLLGNPWNSTQQKGQVVLQRNLFAAVLRSYGRHGLPVSVGEAISRFRDDSRAITDGLDALCDLIGRTLFACVALFVMWRINPTMTAVLVVPLALSGWLSEALGTQTMAYRAASQAATSRVTGFLGELLGGQLALKVAGAVPHAVERLRELGEARRRMAVRDSVFEVMLDSFSINIGHFGTGLVLLLGARAIADRTFTVGDFALFVVYLDQLIWYPAEIARLVSDLKRIDVSVGRMNALVPGDPPRVLVSPRQTQIRRTRRAVAERLERLDVRGLSYAYQNGSGGIRDVSFALERGSFTAITGRIGAGKSTLLHVLLGLLPADDGEILWNGQEVEDATSFFAPPRSAFTPQVPRLFSESLRENLLLGRPEDPVLLNRAVRMAVLEYDVATLERGLDTLVGPRGVKLSGGQVQRAAVARMFLADAELLVFDDVSSALDAPTEAELWSRLFGMGRDMTCLVVSHRPAVLNRADQVLVMDSGRIVHS